MLRLCWIPKTTWSNPYGGIPHSVAFDSFGELKKTMSKCLYNGEWIEDETGNKLDIDVSRICYSR